MNTITKAKYFNATLVFNADEKVIFQLENAEKISFSGPNFQKVGTVGQLSILQRGDVECFTFWAYPDVRLRRIMDKDIPAHGIYPAFWTWQLEGALDSQIVAQEGIIPGIDGRFIENMTSPFELMVPPEFQDLCETFGISVEDVLRGFIADACGLQSFDVLPREDRYSSNGSDERQLAEAYLARAYNCR